MSDDMVGLVIGVVGIICITVMVVTAMIIEARRDK